MHKTPYLCTALFSSTYRKCPGPAPPCGTTYSFVFLIHCAEPKSLSLQTSLSWLCQVELKKKFVQLKKEEKSRDDVKGGMQTDRSISEWHVSISHISPWLLTSYFTFRPSSIHSDFKSLPTEVWKECVYFYSSNGLSNRADLCACWERSVSRGQLSQAKPS